VAQGRPSSLTAARTRVFHDVPARFLAAEMPRLYPFARDHGITRFVATGGATSRPE
jgi:hypothetical protein